MVGTDGQKMSKSYGNVIEIFATADALKKQVFSIKTDSKGVGEPKDPKVCLPYQLFSYFASESERAQIEEKLRSGGVGYAQLKTTLFEKLLEYFGEARERRLELEKKKGFVEDVLEEGGQRARKKARETMEEVHKKIGIR